MAQSLLLLESLVTLILLVTDPQRRNHFQEVFKLHVSASAGVPDAATEDTYMEQPQDRPSQDN